MNEVKKKEIVYFLIKCILFLFILFILDFGIGSLLKNFYFKQQSGLLYRTTYSIDSTNADILIFGSSTGNHDYYPNAFEKRLNMSCYNTGRDGLGIFYFYAVLKGVLKRYSPKVVVLDFNPVEFKKNQRDYDRITALLPYYDNHPEIRSIIQLKSPFEKYKLISKIYPFNSLIFTIAGGNLAFNKDRELNKDEKGYIPLSEIWEGPVVYDTFSVKYELDYNKINMFKSFITDCINSNIKLYIFLSPKYEKFDDEEQSVMIAQKIAKKHGIPFYDFTYNPLFQKNKNLFADEGHLNDNGAKIYTEMVIDKIIQNEKQFNSNVDTIIPINHYSTIRK